MMNQTTHPPIGLKAKTIRAAACSAALLALTLGASAAAATEYTYHYVGNNFTEFAASPSQWDGSDRVDDDAFFDRLREAFTDDEIVDLTVCIAKYLAFGRVHEVLEFESSRPLTPHDPGDAHGL